MANEQRERLEEEERLSEILDTISRRLEGIKVKSGNLKEDVFSIRKTFWDDVTVNVDSSEEINDTLASIKQQSEMLSERERTHGLLYKQAKVLERLKDSPYFGRIDFLEKGEKEAEAIYLGTASLMDDTSEHFLVYDWRAPISSMYYDYSPGPASYGTMDGRVEGKMELKRQFIIRRGEMKGMFDTGVTIGDELLKEVLGNRADQAMKSIVATIQKEQNGIIRNHQARYLIVQGVAGSGKTSVALQRVAYLLYRHLNELRAENILLFSPNPLFNSYVANVLPDLGEENMQQTTYQEYAEKVIGKNVTVESAFAGMEYALTQHAAPDYKSRMKAISFKGSLVFKQEIKAFLSGLLVQGMMFRSLSFRGETIVTAEEMNGFFYSVDPAIHMPNRIQLVKEWLLKKLEARERDEREKEWVLEEVELLDNDDYVEAYQEIQKEKDRETEEYFDEFDREQAKLAARIVGKHFRKLKKAVKLLKFIHLKALYIGMLSSSKHPGMNDEEWKESVQRTEGNLKRNLLPYEDVTAFLYLKDLLEGKKINTAIKYVFIDEAQDYTPFQLEMFKRFFPNSSMTILGDYNQAIYAHSINGTTLMSEDLYDEGKTEKIVMTKSYRSTRQIIEFTKQLMSGGENIQPFNRDGHKPVVVALSPSGPLYGKIQSIIEEWIKKGYQTVAVICKTAEESQRAYAVLSTQMNVQLLEASTYSFQKGVLIMPAYLAKGIEFDAVIIHDASEAAYADEWERNLFYTACTRAMHELILMVPGAPSTFLLDVPEEVYELQKLG
ncbi:RNA polymerase recycling motor HelD [Bacillus testis]|uniref:RNA polymerase recycling motor HelD n=1 Tax=Bacillus testis TaxID=1622072 RepID=UPI00067ED953|nr:RNA polymerase recycling motor HelD [Bacillus testis]